MRAAVFPAVVSASRTVAPGRGSPVLHQSEGLPGDSLAAEAAAQPDARFQGACAGPLEPDGTGQFPVAADRPAFLLRRPVESRGGVVVFAEPADPFRIPAGRAAQRRRHLVRVGVLDCHGQELLQDRVGHVDEPDRGG